MLWRYTEGRLTREQWEDFDDRFWFNVINRPSVHSDDKPYYPVRRQNPDDPDVKEMSFKEMFAMHWRKHGYTDEQIDERFKKWFKGFVLNDG